MDPVYMASLSELGVSLTNMAVKGTASAINNKVKALKIEKDAEKIRNTYDEMLNQLISEREEAIRIAQLYKAELERIVISDDDIEHLHTTVSRLLDLFKALSPGTDVTTYETAKDLISVDTLKAMQLLGFNYKAAIGEPLTALCAEAISSLGKKNIPGKKNNHK